MRWKCYERRPRKLRRLPTLKDVAVGIQPAPLPQLPRPSEVLREIHGEDFMVINFYPEDEDFFTTRELFSVHNLKKS